MSDSKQAPEKWNAEEQREQRKARLAEMKSKDGGKKPIHKSSKAAKIIVSIVLVVALLAGGTWWAINIGIPQRMVTAMTVGTQKVTAAEFNFMYRSQLSYYGIDPTTTDGQTTLKGAYNETFATLNDWLKDSVAVQLQQIVVLSENAKAKGLTLTAEEVASVDAFMKTIEDDAATAKKDADTYLIANYGIGVNKDVVRGIYEKYLLGQKFSTELTKSYTFTDAELQTYYDANKDTFDVADYRTFTIDAVIATDATEEQKTAAMAAAKAKADAMAALITDETTFKAQCIAYAADDTEKTAYTESDKSLVTGAYKADVSDTANSAWLFDAARKTGDKTVTESTTGYTVLYFINRSIADTAHVSVRHILISALKNQTDATTNATAEEIATAQTKADSILAEFKAGAQTEDAFAALATANTADTGSAATGGLYSDIFAGSGMVAEFEAWAVDPSRKTGDTGIVQTDYGFHIMYFVANDGPEWKINVKNTLTNDKFTAYYEEQKALFPYKLDSFGMGFVK